MMADAANMNAGCNTNGLSALREVQRLWERLAFVERWAVYRRFNPDGARSVTAEEAIGVIAQSRPVHEITQRYAASDQIGGAAYEAELKMVMRGFAQEMEEGDE